MPSTSNISILQGDDYAADVTVFYADGTPADLSGYTAEAQIRFDGELSAEFQVSISGGNVITLLLPHDVTSRFAETAYLWDLQLTDGNGWTQTLLSGQILVAKEVTV